MAALSSFKIGVVFRAMQWIHFRAMRAPDRNHHVLSDSGDFLTDAGIVERFAVGGVEEDALASELVRFAIT